MMRVCLIGNSHIGCLKLGWDDIRLRYPDVELTCFGAVAGTIRELEVSEGCLVTSNETVLANFRLTSGGETVIRPENYDVFLLSGLRLSVITALKLALEYRPDTIAGFDTDHVVSEELFELTLTQLYRQTAAAKIARTLRSVTDKRIVVIPQPMPSERFAHRLRGEYAAMFRGSAGERIAALARAAAEAAIGDLAEIVWQPPSLIVHGAFTPHEYSEGSKRFISMTEHREDDFKHMNAKFGAIVLSGVLNGLRRQEKIAV